jgi:FkbM family methyltransferase
VLRTVHVGVLEFMTTKFVKRRFPTLYAAGGAKSTQTSKIFNVSAINWQHSALQQHQQQQHQQQQQKHKDKNSVVHNSIIISTVSCVDLQEVLEAAQVSHVNLLILDVEGAEVSVLKSINFLKTSFDVLIIERQFPNELLHFMKSLPDYELVAAKGRNLWYRRVGFNPSRRSSVNKKCFRGCMAARGHYRCAHAAQECALPSDKSS